MTWLSLLQGFFVWKAAETVYYKNIADRLELLILELLILLTLLLRESAE
jgi:hypothetical protein